jgi:hypothetical protein
MDKYSKFVETLQKGILPPSAVPLMVATVKSVEGETCTIAIGKMELSEVRLKSAIDDKTDRLLITPKKDTKVLVGSLTGDYKDLVVLKVDEMECLEYNQDGLKILIDSKTKKLTIENDQVNLKSILQSLSDLLKDFKVNTPSGPSVSVLPDTMTAILQFENDFKQLLN